MKKITEKSALFLSVILLLSSTACGSEESKTAEEAVDKTAYKNIELGTDHTDLEARINVVTYRTDLIADDPVIKDFHDYMSEFNAMYPGIEVLFEAITDYDMEMRTRLNSGDWDVCSIPSAVQKSELPDYFEPLFNYDDYSDKYEFIDIQSYGGKVYGIPCAGNAQGIVYNKKVFDEAGIEKIPETPDEFIDALKLIKEKTDAIPLYTNYAARWTMGAWDYYCFCGATGNADYRCYVLPYEKAPFSKNEDRTGPYEVFNILYRAVNEGLTEDDPHSTNWELCKARINNGEIGCMALGSWAVPQMQDAGENGDDIGYMPFPISVNGVRYASAAGDYAYAVNKRSDDTEKLAAKLFIKFMIEKSGFAYDQGGIPIVKGEEYPNVFADFEDAVLIKDTPLSEGEEDVYSQVNNDSGLLLESDSEHVIRIVDAALDGSESFDDIMNDWNTKWAAAQKDQGEQE